MKGRTNTSERHSESRERFISKKKAVLLVSFALVVAAFLGAGLLGSDNGPDAPLGVTDANNLDPYELTPTGWVSTDSNSNTFTLAGGYVYKITIQGQSGRSYGGSYNSDTVEIVGWLDAYFDDVDISYGPVSGGKGASGYMSWNWGSSYSGGYGGNAMELSVDGEIAMVAGGGGGSSFDNKFNTVLGGAAGLPTGNGIANGSTGRGNGGGGGTAVGGIAGASSGNQPNLYGYNYYTSTWGYGFNATAGGIVGDGKGGNAATGFSNNGQLRTGGGGGGAGYTGGGGGGTNGGGGGGSSFVGDNIQFVAAKYVSAANTQYIKIEQYSLETYTVDGYVTDDASTPNPISGAGVYFEVTNPMTGQTKEISTGTDSSGYYAVAIPIGTEVRIADAFVSGKTYLELPDEVLTEEDTFSTIVMTSAFYVYGYLSDIGTDSGIGGIKIPYIVYDDPDEPSYRTCLTNSGGYFEFWVPTGWTAEFDFESFGDYIVISILDSSSVPIAEFTADTANIQIWAGIPFTVSGTVIDKGTGPMEGAVVTYDIEYGTSGSFYGTSVTVETDADGLFVIDAFVGWRIIIIAAEDADGDDSNLLGMSETVFTDAADDVVIEFGIPFEVTGTVVDVISGDLLGDIWVEYMLNTSDETFAYATDAYGEFVIKGYVGGTITIVDVWGGSYVFVSGPIDIAYDDETLDLEFEVGIPLFVSGRVTDIGTGLGLEGAVITFTVNGDEYTTETDANGYYTTADVVAYVGTGIAVRITNVEFGNGYVLITSVPTNNATSVTNRNFQMGIPFYVTGKLTNKAGDPIVNARIEYTAPSAPNVRTNAAGEYSIMAYEGQTVTITQIRDPPTVFTVFPILPYSATATEVVNFTTAAPYTITGTTVDTFGNPVGGVTITYNVNGYTGSTTSNNGNGKFTITAPTGYTLTITSASKTGWYIVSLPDPVTESVTGFQVVLAEAADVVGCVTVNGVGLAGVVVNYTVDGQARSVTTDADGNFVINACVGQEVVFVSVVKAGYSLAGALPDCITVASDTKDTPVEITMSANPTGPGGDPGGDPGKKDVSDKDSGSSFGGYALYLILALVIVGGVLVAYFFFIRKP